MPARGTSSKSYDQTFPNNLGKAEGSEGVKCTNTNGLLVAKRIPYWPLVLSLIADLKTVSACFVAFMSSPIFMMSSDRIRIANSPAPDQPVSLETG